MNPTSRIFAAVENIPQDLRDSAQQALFSFSDSLFAVEDRWNELGSEARMVWLDAADFGFFRSPADLRKILSLINDTTSFLTNWSDCATSQKWRRYQEETDDPDTKVVWAADQAGEKARAALHAIVDHLRAVTFDGQLTQR